MYVHKNTLYSLNVFSQVMDLSAVLVRYNGSLSGTRVCTQNNTILVNDTNNCGARFRCCRRLEASLQEGSITENIKNVREVVKLKAISQILILTAGNCRN